MAARLVEKLGGKGDIIAVTGVPGTSVDDQRTKAAKEVFAKNPGIEIVGGGGDRFGGKRLDGEGNDETTEDEVPKVVAIHLEAARRMTHPGAGSRQGGHRHKENANQGNADPRELGKRKILEHFSEASMRGLSGGGTTREPIQV